MRPINEENSKENKKKVGKVISGATNRGESGAELLSHLLHPLLLSRSWPFDFDRDLLDLSRFPAQTRPSDRDNFTFPPFFSILFYFLFLSLFYRFGHVVLIGVVDGGDRAVWFMGFSALQCFPCLYSLLQLRWPARFKMTAVAIVLEFDHIKLASLFLINNKHYYLIVANHH